MVTIFTPTYNRKTELVKLADSIEKQTDKDFEWIIIDDGSTDGTEKWIGEYKKKSEIKISYYKQKNQGKHIAINCGIDKCSGEWFFCVDSDDTLTKNAIENINAIAKEFNDRLTVGMVFPKINNLGSKEKNWYRINGKFLDIMDLKEMYNIKESTIVIRQSILKNYKFPQLYKKNGEPEKFMPEGYLYGRLTEVGKFYAINKNIYIFEYQENGLTNNVFSLWINNYNGVILSLSQKYVLARKYKLWQKILTQSKCIININSLCLKIKEDIFKYTPSKMMSLLLLFPSIIFMKLRFKL